MMSIIKIPYPIGELDWPWIKMSYLVYCLSDLRVYDEGIKVELQ